MRLTKKINLTDYTVFYVDLRDPKPRQSFEDHVILDGGRISALHRLGQTDTGWIVSMYEKRGLAVEGIVKGKPVTAEVDLTELWCQAKGITLLPAPGAEDDPTTGEG